MAKVYLPTQYLNKPCYVINDNYIRVYNTINLNQQNVVYDVYFRSDYLVRQTTATYNSNTLCDTINTYTDTIYYRYDISDILLIFFILFLFIFMLPYKIFSRVFGRWLKI